MHLLDQGRIRGRRWPEIVEPVRAKQGTQESILSRRKLVPLRQRDRVVVAIVELPGRRLHAPISRRMTSAMLALNDSTCPASDPSTITRARGSVPEKRTRTLPDPANASSAR